MRARKAFAVGRVSLTPQNSLRATAIGAIRRGSATRPQIHTTIFDDRLIVWDNCAFVRPRATSLRIAFVEDLLRLVLFVYPLKSAHRSGNRSDAEIQSRRGFHTHTIGNGLQVYTVEIKSPTVAVKVWYHVDRGRPRGGAVRSYVEHMMFKQRAPDHRHVRS